MRIEFANTDRQPLPWDGAELRVGSAADNDVVLPHPGVAAQHLRLLHDARGLVMRVEAGAGRVYVNARPVRERALLRAGDSLGVGGYRLRLCADVPQDAVDQGEAEPRASALAALRIVAGPLCGRVLALDRRLELGSRGRLPLALPDADGASLVLTDMQDGWRVDASGLPSCLAMQINGNVLPTARLRPGDQIALGVHHFVFDGWPSEPVTATEKPELLPETLLPEDRAGPRGEVWWLIATAAAIGLAIALLLFVRL